MTAPRPHLFGIACIVLGVVLVGFGQSSLVSRNALRHSHNTFAVQGSAYGKLLTRLSETTIDRVWHLGVEQIVPHYMTGESPATAHSHDKPKGPAPVAKREAPIEAGKHWINQRVVAQHTRTNKHSLSDAHLATVYRDIEEMLLRSFKLDPTHYGAYDSYHLFLTTTDFGGTPMANEQARKIAAVVMNAVRNETEDPEPWLTAATAGMNLFMMESAPYAAKNERIPLEILRKYRDDIAYCLKRFDEIQARSEKAGNWALLSQERQREIIERDLFLSRGFKQFDVLIARAESAAAPAKEGEVAKAPESEE